MNWFLFKACSKCRGDLVLDEGDWLCLQCGTYYYTDLYRGTGAGRKPPQDSEPRREDKTLLPARLAAGFPAEMGGPVVPVDRPNRAFITSQRALGPARLPGSGPMALKR